MKKRIGRLSLIRFAAPLLAATSLTTPLASPEDSLGKELQAAMIWAPAGAKLQSPFVAFRKSFNLQRPPQAALVHLFADARYLLWINGKPASRGPARFDPRGPEYDSVEISQLLKAGENQVTVLVMAYADGIGETKPSVNARMMKHPPGLTLRIDADGGQAVRTDSSWKWSDQTRYRAPSIDWAQIKDRIDARVEDGDWTKPDYKDDSWKPAVPAEGSSWGPLSARRIPLLRDTPVTPTFLDGKKLPVTLNAGEQLSFTIGRLIQAYTVIELEAEDGTELTLDHQKVDYTAKKGRQSYISSDSIAFAGGAIKVKAGRATIISLGLVERLYPFARVGSFKSNDELLDRIWAVCARSNEILSEDSYVDCADRERAEWMDDDPPGFNVTRTAFAGPGREGKPVYSDPRLLGELLRRTALTQQKEGWVKAHTTSDRFDIHAQMEDRSCDWVEGARRYYESTGDLALLREIWPVIVNQMNYFLARRTSRGLVVAREWVVWGNPVGYQTCEGAGLNAFVYKALVDAAYLGGLIGESKQAATFAEAAKELAKAFNTWLWNEDEGTYYSGYYSPEDLVKAGENAKKMKLAVKGNLIEATMFPALFALDQGIVPDARLERVRHYLFAHRQEAERMMTFYYLFNQMYFADDLAFDREVLETIRAKWKGMAESPWGTTWEEFKGGSKAHIYGMFPGYYLSAYVLGVRLDGPVTNKRILIEPRLGDLTFAEGTVVTEFGPVRTSWKVEPGKLTFQVQVPPQTKALLRMHRLGSEARLSVNGKPGLGKMDGRYVVTELGAGVSEGTMTFTSDN